MRKIINACNIKINGDYFTVEYCFSNVSENKTFHGRIAEIETDPEDPMDDMRITWKSLD